jgi:hypothetical protein
MSVLNQYFVVSVDQDGENMDLFVTARDALRAIELWRDYYEGWSFDEKNIRVFPAPSPVDVEMAHPWNDAEVDTRK